MGVNVLKGGEQGASLVDGRLRLKALSAGELSSLPGWGTRCSNKGTTWTKAILPATMNLNDPACVTRPAAVSQLILQRKRTDQNLLSPLNTDIARRLLLSGPPAVSEIFATPDLLRWAKLTTNSQVRLMFAGPKAPQVALS